MIAERDIVLKVEGLSKKFCKDLRWGMIHGSRDVTKSILGIKGNPMKLRRHEFWALKDMSFELKRGSILGVLGKNGSGKTTLMRILAGIYPFESGRLELTGQVVPLFGLKTGMHPFFSGLENIFIKGAMYGMSKKEIKQKLDYIIDFSELEAFIDAPLGTYSSGMRARLGYAIAIAAPSEILIIDEGLAVGDAAFKAKCLDNLATTSSERGVIFITHSAGRIRRVATDIMVMEKGKKIFETGDIEKGIEFYLENCGPNAHGDDD